MYTLTQMKGINDVYFSVLLNQLGKYIYVLPGLIKY